MTTIDTRPETVVEPSAADAPSAPAGIAGWLTTVDHTKVGRLYVGSSLVLAVAALAIGGLLAVERIDTPGTLLDADAIAQLFALYWYGLAFLVVVPMLLGLAMAVVPLQLGRDRIAFPRLAALSFWTWLLGGAVMVSSFIANGGPGGGEQEAVDLFLASFVVVLVALVLGAICVVTTVLTLRADGMGVLDVPPFSFASLVSGSGLVLLLPIVVAKTLHLYIDHRYGRLVFGGNVGVSGNLDWSLLQPANYVYAIPVLGVAAEVVATFTRRRLLHRAVLFSLIGLAIASVASAAFEGVFLLELGDGAGTSDWNTAVDTVVYGITAVLPILPFLGVLGILGLTLKARPTLRSPLLFGLVALLMGLVGTLVGSLTGILDIPGGPLAGTAYQEAQANYMLLASLVAGLGALVYWGPKLWGRRLPDTILSGVAVIALLGVVAVSFPAVIAGWLDLPLNDAITGHDGPQAFLAVCQVAGFGLLVVAVLTVLLAATRFFLKGEDAGDDPWDGQTLEWAIPSPPDGAVADVGRVESPEPLLDRKTSGSDA
jgi:heme/copper-type cytochrome/quinol oxidase subunit 1